MDIDDERYIRAAEGWVGLGLYNEAADELANVSLAAHDEPEFLEICCKIYAKFNRWVECFNIAKAIVDQDDDNVMGHIQLAHALVQLKGDEDAYNYLRPVADRITDSITIFYSIGCFACKLGRLEEARKWLEISFQMSESDDYEYGLFYRNFAQDDPDLKPLWGEISRIGRRLAGGLSHPPRWSGDLR